MDEKEVLYENIFLHMSKMAAPFTYAKEIGEEFGVSSQKASGALKALERRSQVCSKRIKCGRNEVNIYYLPKEV